jgi:hypothetical protein
MIMFAARKNREIFMLRMRSKAIIAALAAIAIGGLVTLESASASTPSTLLEVCNGREGLLYFDVEGTNQDGEKVQTYSNYTIWPEDEDGCDVVSNHWWAIGTQLTINYAYDRSGSSKTPFIANIPESAEDGGTQVVNVP